MVSEVLDSSWDPEVEGLRARLKIDEKEILVLRNKVGEQDQQLLIADQMWSIMEAKASEYEHLCHSLEEANRKIELLEAQASMSEVLHADLLVEIEKAKEVTSIATSN